MDFNIYYTHDTDILDTPVIVKKGELINETEVRIYPKSKKLNIIYENEKPDGYGIDISECGEDILLSELFYYEKYLTFITQNKKKSQDTNRY